MQEKICPKVIEALSQNITGARAGLRKQKFALHRASTEKAKRRATTLRTARRLAGSRNPEQVTREFLLSLLIKDVSRTARFGGLRCPSRLFRAENSDQVWVEKYRKFGLFHALSILTIFSIQYVFKAVLKIVVKILKYFFFCHRKYRFVQNVYFCWKSLKMYVYAFVVPICAQMTFFVIIVILVIIFIIISLAITLLHKIIKNITIIINLLNGHSYCHRAFTCSYFRRINAFSNGSNIDASLKTGTVRINGKAMENVKVEGISRKLKKRRESWSRICFGIWGHATFI